MIVEAAHLEKRHPAISQLISGISRDNPTFDLSLNILAKVGIEKLFWDYGICKDKILVMGYPWIFLNGIT